MKKILLFLLILTTLLWGVPTLAYAEDSTEGVSETPIEVTEQESVTEAAEDEAFSFEHFRTYAEEKIIPIVVFVITAIGTIYVAISPVLGRIKKASEKFKSATEDVNGARDESYRTRKEMKALEEELRCDIVAVKEHERKTDETLQRMEHIMRVGFENIPELVAGGYAREIERIATAGEERKEDEHVEVEG